MKKLICIFLIITVIASATEVEFIGNDVMLDPLRNEYVAASVLALLRDCTVKQEKADWSCNGKIGVRVKFDKGIFFDIGPSTKNEKIEIETAEVYLSGSHPQPSGSLCIVVRSKDAVFLFGKYSIGDSYPFACMVLNPK